MSRPWGVRFAGEFGGVKLAMVGALCVVAACGGVHELDLGADLPSLTDDDAAVVGTGGAPADATTSVLCDAQSADCDGDPATGCEASLLSDPAHCGGCGIACDFPDCVCEDGVRSLACPAGRGDCDGDPSNGCETDTQTQLNHCGGCGVTCATSGYEVRGGVCEGGQCALVCENLSHGDCDGNPSNGCEVTHRIDDNNCGACGVVCSCSNGVCI